MIGAKEQEGLAAAVIAIARTRVAAVYKAEDLFDLIRVHWPANLRKELPQYSGRIVGLLRYEGWERIVTNGVREVSELRRLIESNGVLFWDHYEDDRWRIVDTNWLQMHAEIRRWVLDPWSGGRRCRFCGCLENPSFNSLQPVEIERRNGTSMIGDRSVLVSGSVNTHGPCATHWLNWVAIASQYPNQEAAQSADQEAGRRSRHSRLAQTSVLTQETAASG
jgi:hypothetical protein